MFSARIRYLKFKAFLAGALLCALSSSAPAADAPAPETPPDGHICLAPVSQPAPQLDEIDAGVDYAATDLPPPQFSVEVGTRGEIAASPSRALSLGPIPFGEKHLIKVRADGEMVQAFLLDFAEQEEDDFCLLYQGERDTWALRPASEVGEPCFCDHRAYVAPELPSEDADGLEQGKQ